MIFPLPKSSIVFKKYTWCHFFLAISFLFLGQSASAAAPTITSATLDYNNGNLIITGTDFVTLLSVTGFHLNDTTGADDITLSVGSGCTVDNVTTINCTLTEAQRVAALALSGEAGGDGGAVVLDVDAAAIEDALNVPNVQDDNNTVTETPDTTAPVLTETTPIVTPSTDRTPSYTLSTDEAGAITYGSCTSAALPNAVVGTNTVTFDTLTQGNYNCTIKVTDPAGNISNVLNQVFSIVISTGSAPVTPSISVCDPLQGNPQCAKRYPVKDGSLAYTNYKSCSKRSYECLSDWVREKGLFECDGINDPCSAPSSFSPNKDLPLKTQSPKAQTPLVFSDVPLSVWERSYVDEVSARGIMTGYDDGSQKFGIHDPITNAQILKVGLEAFDHNVVDFVAEEPFKDVPVSEWFAPYVETAKSLGILPPIVMDRIMPNKPLNRSQATRILVAFAGIDISTQGNNDSQYQDIPADPETRDAILWATENGIVNGYEPNENGDIYFGSKDSLTRGQLAKIVVNLLKYLEKRF